LHAHHHCTSLLRVAQDAMKSEIALAIMSTVFLKRVSFGSNKVNRNPWIDELKPEESGTTQTPVDARR